VFWIYYSGNDLMKTVSTRPSEIETESGQKLLMNYLDEGFSQGLWNIKGMLNDKLTSILEARIASRMEAAKHPAPPKPPDYGEIAIDIREWLTLQHTISTVYNGLFHRFIDYRYRDVERVDRYRKRDVGLFQKILARAKADVEAWGGALVFVYLPEYQSINRFPHPLRRDVLELVDKLAIDRIDLFGTFIADHDPSRMFALGKRGGHYSAAGYDLVYRAIRDYLSGGPPSKK
jgi:hypothetical protein